MGCGMYDYTCKRKDDVGDLWLLAGLQKNYTRVQTIITSNLKESIISLSQLPL